MTERKHSADKTVAETEEDLFKARLHDVQPGDEVGTLRARKAAQAMAPDFHEFIQLFFGKEPRP